LQMKRSRLLKIDEAINFQKTKTNKSRH
jgi:hypothetical protein